MKAFSATAIVCFALIGSSAFATESDYPCEAHGSPRYHAGTVVTNPAVAQAQAERDQAEREHREAPVKPLTQRQYDCIADSLQANAYGDVYYNLTNEEIEKLLADKDAYGHYDVVRTAHDICGIRHR